jgi:dienelactone hydrolase
MRGDRKRRGRRVLPVVTAATVMALSVPALAGVAGAVPAAEPVARSGALTEQEVTFHNGGLALHGTIIAPGGRATGRPGVVLVGGSGRGLRDAHREEAEAFARAGIVALVYDKRTVGYSMLHRPLPDLAGDALAAVEVLRARPDVDAAGVGLWGLSEGTWVSELAAARSSSVSFLVLVGASAVSPARQQAWYLGNALVYAGVSGSMLHALPVMGTRLLAGLGVLPNADFDPVPVLSSVRQPVLALWGERDRSSPPGESAALMDGALERAGNSHRTLRFLTGAQHDLHRSQDGFDGSDEWAPGYPGVVTEWITGLGAARPVVSVDPLPAARPVPALPPPAWYE